MKKIRRHRKSAIDLSNANPTHGYKEVRTSTGYSMLTTRYSDQQRSKLPHYPCQVQPSQNIGNLSASRQCCWVRITVSTFWSAASVTSYREICLICCPSNKAPESDTRCFQAFEGLHEAELCGNLQAMAPTNVKTVHQTSLLQIESDLDRLGSLSPTHGQRSEQQSGQTTLQSVLINKPNCFKATYHTEICKIEISGSMVVGTLR